MSSSFQAAAVIVPTSISVNPLSTCIDGLKPMSLA
jgi:hypothetical protein